MPTATNPPPALNHQSRTARRKAMADAVHNAVEKGADKAAAIGNVARSYGVSIWTVRAALQVHPAEAKAEKKSRRKAS